MKFLIYLYFLFFSLSCFSSTEDSFYAQNYVLNYWFGHLDSAQEYPQKQSKIWFDGGVQIDQEIRERFEYLLIKAKNHELDHWNETPKGRLALILIVDQFPRNIYRGTKEAFAFDALDQALTLEGLDSGDDLQLFPIERAFFYLPLEHAEDLILQELSLEKFNQLAAIAPSSLKSVFDSFANYARQHYEVIARFGHFPHRNTILDRPATE